MHLTHTGPVFQGDQQRTPSLHVRRLDVEQAVNDGDLSPADLAAIDAELPRPGTEAFYEAADRGVEAAKRANPYNSLTPSELARAGDREQREAAVRGSL